MASSSLWRNRNPRPTTPPPHSDSRCRRNGNGTRPPGSAWPHNPTDWPDKLDTIRWVYGEIVRKISPGETVRILVNSRSDERLAHGIWPAPGRTPVRRVHRARHQPRLDARQRPVFVAAYGPAPGGDRDRALSLQCVGEVPGLAERPSRARYGGATLGKRVFQARHGGRDFVLEGGGIDVNGRGTLLTTEECYLAPFRAGAQPGDGAVRIRRAVRRYLGARNVLWLGTASSGDDTHGHVDDICRFVNPTTVVLVREENPA